MWIFTETGFISAVAHRTQPGMLMIRARDRVSLEMAFPLAEIMRTPDGDYPYRVVVPSKDLIDFMSVEIENLDYPNFKTQVKVVRGSDYAHTLTEVWSVMHDVEDKKARKGRRKFKYGDYKSSWPTGAEIDRELEDLMSEYPSLSEHWLPRPNAVYSSRQLAMPLEAERSKPKRKRRRRKV